MRQFQRENFRRHVYGHHTLYGRSFPWRPPALKLKKDGVARDPYRVIISEVMLQQTQAGGRTIAKYEAFLKRFPSFEDLACAPLRDVLSVWQGLGYNRRAKYLKALARIVFGRHGGVLPNEREELEALPGVGSYTAGAVQVFAFNRPVALLETNVRTVFIHHFFKNRDSVSDTDIGPLVEETLDGANPRLWYEALMDYGAMLKKTVGNAGRRSRHYARQSRFEDSDRQIRGLLLKHFLESRSLTGESAASYLKRDVNRVKTQLGRLAEEGFVVRKGEQFFLKS